MKNLSWWWERKEFSSERRKCITEWCPRLPSQTRGHKKVASYHFQWQGTYILLVHTLLLQINHPHLKVKWFHSKAGFLVAFKILLLLATAGISSPGKNCTFSSLCLGYLGPGTQWVPNMFAEWTIPTNGSMHYLKGICKEWIDALLKRNMQRKAEVPFLQGPLENI